MGADQIERLLWSVLPLNHCRRAEKHAMSLPARLAVQEVVACIQGAARCELEEHVQDAGAVEPDLEVLGDLAIGARVCLWGWKGWLAAPAGCDHCGLDAIAIGEVRRHLVGAPRPVVDGQLLSARRKCLKQRALLLRSEVHLVTRRLVDVVLSIGDESVRVIEHADVHPDAVELPSEVGHRAAPLLLNELHQRLGAGVLRPFEEPRHARELGVVPLVLDGGLENVGQCRRCRPAEHSRVPLHGLVLVACILFAKQDAERQGLLGVDVGPCGNGLDGAPLLRGVAVQIYLHALHDLGREGQETFAPVQLHDVWLHNSLDLLAQALRRRALCASPAAHAQVPDG
eukprot:4419343-Pyramimonas_sp.AAC.2